MRILTTSTSDATDTTTNFYAIGNDAPPPIDVTLEWNPQLYPQTNFQITNSTANYTIGGNGAVIPPRWQVEGAGSGTIYRLPGYYTLGGVDDGTTFTCNTIHIQTQPAWEVQVFDYIDGWKSKRYKPAQRLMNHRGEPLRSEFKGQQWSNVEPEELVALQLLRKMVGPEDFRKYLKHGFVSVRGQSGLVYQIGRRELIKVWDDGELVATLCVHLRDWYGKPPTDEVVAKMLIAECDEQDLWKRSNTSFRAPALTRERPRLKVVGVR